MHIINADCLKAMPTLPENSVDCVVTDPPYGLSFMGKDWDHGVPGVEFWKAAYRVMKPGAFLLAFGGTRTHHRLTCAIEDAGFEIRDCMMWLYGSGFPKSHNLRGEWSGWGTALKPAWEPIIVARKPLEGTVAENVQKWGTGAMNIDGGRISTTERWIRDRTDENSDKADTFENGFKNTLQQSNSLGRWPANVILDEEAGEMLDGQSGVSGGSGKRVTKKQNSMGFAGGETVYDDFSYADTGGASRFFYCAKTSKRERGEGNNHPTVKPLALMTYLIKLVCPPGGVVLDPFTGSGSTGLAAQGLGLDFIGIEKEAAYVEIVNKRIGAI